MNQEEARSRILDLYSIESSNPKGIPALEWFLQLIYNNGLVIAKTSNEMTATAIVDFEQTVLAWNLNEKMELEDINGQAVLYALKEKGWVILPPV